MPISIAGEPLIAFLLASVRIVSWLVVVPPFSSRSVPTMAKVVLSLGLAFAAAPAVDATIATDTIGLITTAFIQVAIGLAMGFVTSLLFGAVAAAGSLVDVFGGFSLAQGFDPLGMNSSTVFGTFHQGLATALLFVSGGYLLVIGGLLKTFAVLPIGATPDLSGAEDVVTTAFVMFFVTAVQIALPLVAVLFIADLGLALLTKVAPQLNALSVMFPAKIALTLLIVGISFALLPDVLRNIVDLTLAALAALAGGGRVTGEKTEKATPKRRKEARKEGQVARTPEIGAWAALLLFTLALPTLVRRESAALQALFQEALTAIRHPTIDAAFRVLREGAGHAFLAIVVLGSLVMVVGVAAAVAQGGFFLATKTVKPSGKKLNPVSGFKRIFGPQMLWEGAKTLLKSAAVALLVWSSLRTMLPVIGAPASPELLLSHTGDRAIALVRSIALAGLVMGALDYAWQRRKVGKQTKMSKDDVKQEYRQSEGDPLVKSAIRARQLAASRNRMLADVPTADVVLVNPTHVAVALRYDANSGAPLVVARGAGVVAAKIRELAGEASVPLVRDVPLARALYASTEVGREIPAELFAAVAQVLAFVISRRSRGQRGGEHRSPRPAGEIATPPRAGQRRRAAGSRRAPSSESELPPAVPGRRRANLSAPVPAGR